MIFDSDELREPAGVPEAGHETARLEAFSDGVFAIAITLLVLDIKVPSAEAVTAGTLGSVLLDQWPVYLAYVFSFLTILIMWVQHHAVFKYIAHTNQAFLLINGLLLMGITAVPFPTALLSEYLKQADRPADQRMAAAVYSGLFMGIAVLFNALWHYAVRAGLMGQRLDPVFAQALARRYMFGPLFYLISLLLALTLGAWASLASYVLFAAFYALPTPTAAKE